MMSKSTSPDTREEFWKEKAQQVHWSKFPDVILDSSNPPFYRWFNDGEINMSYNCLDRHVEEGRGDNICFVYDNVYNKVKKQYTYKEALEKVSRLAAVFVNKFGIEPRDRILIYMPMIPEAAFAMLASARIGAIHSVVFGGFSAAELSNRINDSAPKLIVTASCGIEPKGFIPYIPIVEEALEMSKAQDTKRLIV